MILLLDHQVTSFELSHDLVEADVVMNTIFFWVSYLDGRIKVESAAVAKRQHRFCSAYTSGELGILLPTQVQTLWRYVDDQGPRWICTYENEEEGVALITTQEQTEADARGKMLLEILKIKLPKTKFWKENEEEDED